MSDPHRQSRSLQSEDFEADLESGLHGGPRQRRDQHDCPLLEVARLAKFAQALRRGSKVEGDREPRRTVARTLDDGELIQSGQPLPGDLTNAVARSILADAEVVLAGPRPPSQIQTAKAPRLDRRQHLVAQRQAAGMHQNLAREREPNQLLEQAEREAASDLDLGEGHPPPLRGRPLGLRMHRLSRPHVHHPGRRRVGDRLTLFRSSDTTLADPQGERAPSARLVAHLVSNRGRLADDGAAGIEALDRHPHQHEPRNSSGDEDRSEQQAEDPHQEVVRPGRRGQADENRHQQVEDAGEANPVSISPRPPAWAGGRGASAGLGRQGSYGVRHRSASWKRFSSPRRR